MTEKLSEVLAKIGEDYRENIRNDSRHYLEISLAQKAAELGFYVAFLDGLLKEFFKELPAAFEVFTKTNDWDTIEQALASGYQTATRHAGLIMDLYREGVDKNDLKRAEVQIQKRLLGKYAK